MTKSKRPGRPTVGPRIAIRMPAAQLEGLDQIAKEDGISRAAVARQMVSEGIHARIPTVEPDAGPMPPDLPAGVVVPPKLPETPPPVPPAKRWGGL